MMHHAKGVKPNLQGAPAQRVGTAPSVQQGCARAYDRGAIGGSQTGLLRGALRAETREERLRIVLNMF